jgi:hypothetical protein
MIIGLNLLKSDLVFMKIRTEVKYGIYLGIAMCLSVSQIY